jgi:fucose permease
MAAFFVLNLGFGMMEISLGVIAATTFTRNTGRMINLAHFFYGFGSVCSPILSTGLILARFGDQILGWRYMYLIVLSFALIPAMLALLGRIHKQDYNKKKTGYAALLKKPTLWLTVMILAFGAVSEMGIGAWLVNYLEKAYFFTSEQAALRLTLFFVCFTLTRLLLGPAIDRIGFINSLAIVTAFTGVMITAGVLLGEAGSVLLILAGVGVAPIFPTVMALIAKLFADEIDLAMTSIITAMGIIMMPANLLIGGIINYARTAFSGDYGDAGIRMAYAAGFLFMALCSFGSFVFTMVLRARQRKAGQLV